LLFYYISVINNWLLEEFVTYNR